MTPRRYRVIAFPGHAICRAVAAPRLAPVARMLRLLPTAWLAAPRCGRRRRPTCRVGSAAPWRSAGRRRRDSGASAARRRWPPRRPVSGRTWTTWPSCRWRRRSPAASSVCQRSSSSVIPLNVLPTITKPSSPRAPRWRLDSQPWRRPWPHSAARTTRSNVCTGLTLRHEPPRRPAAYGDARSLTITPSSPRPTASSMNAAASSASAVTIEGRRNGSGHELVEGIASTRRQRLVDQRRRRRRGGRRRSRRPSPPPRPAAAWAPKSPIVSWKRRGPPSSVEPGDLAVEHEIAAGQAGDERHDAGQAVGDVVEVAREQAHARRHGDGPARGRRRASTRPTPCPSGRAPRPRRRRVRRASARPPDPARG